MSHLPGESRAAAESSVSGLLSAPGKILTKGAAGCVAAFWNFPLLAQTPAPVSDPVRPMYLEWGLTGGMIALAIFVVCRKSNRT